MEKLHAAHLRICDVGSKDLDIFNWWDCLWNGCSFESGPSLQNAIALQSNNLA